MIVLLSQTKLPDSSNPLSDILGAVQGVRQDYTRAVKWYEKAAVQGDARAQIRLGHMYEKGTGVEKDESQALQYYLLACNGEVELGCNNYRKLQKKGVSELRHGFNSQEYFLKVVSEAQRKGKGADNDMQLGGIKAERDKKICKILEDTTIKNWSGRVSTISANREGRGILSIELDKGVSVTTWNNAFSDVFSDTLIEPGSKLFETASALRVGERVVFSGKFVKDGDNCLREPSLRLKSEIANPQFIFKFISIEK
jgi:hypothetical protein